MPVESSVSVSVPNRMTASYTFGAPSIYGSRRVARPTRRTSSPVANGSSVPAWPTRRSPSERRVVATTSCDVIPAGLSTRRIPSLGGLPIPWRSIMLDLREQRLDARGPLHALVAVEHDFRCEAQPELPSDMCPKVARDALEPLERRVLLRVRAHHAHEDLRVAEVACDVHSRHGHEADDARILHAF